VSVREHFNLAASGEKKGNIFKESRRGKIRKWETDIRKVGKVK